MGRVKEDKEREKRIDMEIVVDAYSEEERAMGWYYYLENRMRFPFRAQGILERQISPVKKGEVVEVVGMAPEDDCEKEMFVEI